MKKYLGEDQRGPKCRGFHPHRVGVYHPPGTWMSSPTQKRPELHTLQVCMEPSSCRHHRSLIPFSTILPFLEGGVKSSKPSSWLGLSGDQLSSGSSPRVGSLDRKTLLSPRKLQGFQEPCVRNQGSKTKYRNKRCCWRSSHLGNCKNFRSSVLGTGGRDQYILYIILHPPISTLIWRFHYPIPTLV